MNNKEKTDFRSGFVALLGRPNAGKSSIINAMIREKVAAVSSKPQTTRNAVRCILTTEREQIVFVDTPGVHEPRHVLGEFMMKEAVESLLSVDVICLVAEAGDVKIGPKDAEIISVLSAHPNIPIILIVNKIDKFVAQDYYMKTAQVYENELNVSAVVPLSALKNFNIDLLLKTIREFLPQQPPIYPEDMLMDTTERFLAAEIIREKIFLNTEEEIPHGTAVLIDEFKSPDEYPELDKAMIQATIIVDRSGHKGIIIGKNGAKLKSIGRAARKELEERFGFPVYLDLWVKVKPGWRKSPEELRRLGYKF